MTIGTSVEPGYILKKYKTVAVVGCSRDTYKDSHKIPAYLAAHGYRIIPINPFAVEIFGERAYPSLSEMPGGLKREVEIVCIFRPSTDALKVVEEAVEMKREHNRPYVIWMQLGVSNEVAARKARNAMMTVFMDKCMMVEHEKMLRQSGKDGNR
jgi:hypothetical protein